MPDLHPITQLVVEWRRSLMELGHSEEVAGTLALGQMVAGLTAPGPDEPPDAPCPLRALIQHPSKVVYGGGLRGSMGSGLAGS